MPASNRVGGGAKVDPLIATVTAYGTAMDSGRFEFVAITDEESLEGFQALTRLEGIMPALESAHAVAHAMRLAKTLPRSKAILVGLSGRGDKDVHVVAKALGMELG